ncbi:unnamed protein product [Caenorhabditis auriculariae]|uniref:Lysophospholipid acyltransferase 7 n=1 Tax=Caenorhabditis auriculariae TaxID=2777116 RepID=A0A8S1H0W7_9PELO|nr:unnamed protein product [Caenorhabditis auriculariae]
MAICVLRTSLIYSSVLFAFMVSVHHLAPPVIQTRVVFVGSFAYLVFLRYIHYIFNVVELASHANVVQLIITLRVIGLTFEISDYHHAKKTGKAAEKRMIDAVPTLLEKFFYCYHFCGLFTGPYYTYVMLHDSTNAYLKNWNPSSEVFNRLQRLFWSVPMFVILNKIFPLDGLRTDAVWEMTLFYRFVYAAAVFAVFRARVYSAWAIAESICVLLGIGVYPASSKPKIVVGPTDLAEFNKSLTIENPEMSTEAIVNLDIPKVEASDGFREGIRSWNRSVQSWLALYVHSRSPKAYRVELTLFVSALWHGTYAGYFMSFLIVPMCTTIEDIIFRMVPVEPETGKRPFWFRIIYILTLRSRGFDMLATGFLLKNFHDTHRFWSSIYYWLLIVALPIYLFDKINYFMKKKKDTSTPSTARPKAE